MTGPKPPGAPASRVNQRGAHPASLGPLGLRPIASRHGRSASVHVLLGRALPVLASDRLVNRGLTNIETPSSGDSSVPADCARTPQHRTTVLHRARHRRLYQPADILGVFDGDASGHEALDLDDQ